MAGAVAGAVTHGRRALADKWPSRVGVAGVAARGRCDTAGHTAC